MPIKPERIQLQQKREINSTKANILPLSLSSSNNSRNFIKANIHLLPCKASNSSKIISSKINSQSSMKHHSQSMFSAHGLLSERWQHELRRAVSLFDPLIKPRCACVLLPGHRSGPGPRDLERFNPRHAAAAAAERGSALLFGGSAPAMVLQRILVALINKAQLVERLSESRAIRRAAQLTAFAITKGQLVGKQASARVLESSTVRHMREEARRRPQSAAAAAQTVSRLKDTFVKELKEGMREASRQMKDRK
ncbi:hypothetical protein AOLI_G00213290 [Acnodon oligacanthus]